MQINRTGYFLLAFFFFGGLAFTVVDFLIFDQPIFIGPIWMVVSIGLGLYAIASARKGRRDQELFKTGVKGKGTLVSASTGPLINNQPQMKLVLDIEVPGQESRRVTRKMVISTFAAHRMQPGLVLPVYADPANPDDILVVW